MEKQDMYKLMGLVIVIIMGFSMFAVLTSSLTTNNNASSTDTSNDLPSSTQTTTFNYTFSFPATALKELGTLRFAGITTELDKQKIDAALLKLEKVSRVTSTFSKAASGATDAWVYRADVTLAKGATAQSVANDIKQISFFSQQDGATQAMKMMTIAAPKTALLHNADLNLDRNYSFASTTLSSLVNMDTLPNDSLIVSGTISLLGNTTTALQLQESQNITNSPKAYTLTTALPIASLGEQVSIEASTDNNAIDTNKIKADIAKVDANATVFVSNASATNPTTTIYVLLEKQTTTTNVLALLTKAKLTSKAVQGATFFTQSITIADLNATFDYNSPISATVTFGHKVNDAVPLTLTANVKRGTLLSVTGEEK